MDFSVGYPNGCLAIQVSFRLSRRSAVVHFLKISLHECLRGGFWTTDTFFREHRSICGYLSLNIKGLKTFNWFWRVFGYGYFGFLWKTFLSLKSLFFNTRAKKNFVKWTTAELLDGFLSEIWITKQHLDSQTNVGIVYWKRPFCFG